ncbi:hypothetical protein C8T65DRAFT_31800 [Cerioporus squamosus]|nr:hypothetical protein C8T65DRAFT_31800 [Cerioporus squamosus]
MAQAAGLPESESGGATAPTQQPLVMQIVVRRDLLDAEGWGVGPLMAQVAHATSAVTVHPLWFEARAQSLRADAQLSQVLHETRERPETQAYLDDLKNMRKVVMQTTDQASIEKLAKLLDACDPPVPYHLWIEQPENIPTCLALSPIGGSPRSRRHWTSLVAGCGRLRSLRLP